MKLTKVELRKIIKEELDRFSEAEKPEGDPKPEGGKDVEKIADKMDQHLGALWGLIRKEEQFVPLMKKFLQSATSSGKVTPAVVKRTLVALAKDVSQAP